MRTIFYLFGLIAMAVELGIFQETKKYITGKTELKKRKPDEYTTNMNVFVVFTMAYYIWVLAGLLSSQWPLFVAFLALSAIPKGNRKYLIKADAIISAMLIIFIILNRYHLHINIWEWIKHQL